MTRTLQNFSESRGLQLVSLLAWLLLAITPAFGMPEEMIGGMQHPGYAARIVEVPSHADHAVTLDSDRPCRGSDEGDCNGHACGCAAACGNVAIVTATGEFAPTRFASAPWNHLRTHVPDSGATPPLRPPTA